MENRFSLLTSNIHIATAYNSEHCLHLNSLSVIIYTAVWLTHWTQSFESALGKNLEVGTKTLVAL